jgi:ABC-type uncharacterized transport system involved in gliding motility auxiliary subunit
VEELMRKYLQKLDYVGLALLIAALFSYWGTRIWHWWILALAIAGGVLVVLGTAVNFRQIMSTMGKRSTKYAANYALSVLLVVVLLAGLNYLGHRHPKRFDLTAQGSFSLASQTLQVLDQLDQPLQIKAFFPGGDYRPLRALLTEYRARSRAVEFEFIDPDRRPDVAEDYDVSVYGTFSNPFTGSQLKSGTVVLLHGGKREKIEKRSEEVLEEDITNAIIKLQRQESKKIYFVQGHGEKDPSSAEREGYSIATTSLENQGFLVESLNLAAAGEVPDDAHVVVLAGPTNDPFPQELELLEAFLNRGGGLLVMVDPHPSPSLSGFLEPWGVRVGDNVVLDVSGAGRLMGAGPSIPLVLEYENHKLTERFKEMTFFPLARSVEPSEQIPEGVRVEPLFRSNENSWGETDFDTNEASFDEEDDHEGPLTLAVAVTKEIREATEEESAVQALMVVVGDADFAANPSFRSQGNGNLFLNMVSWLSAEEDLISIRPKDPQDKRILLSQTQQWLILVGVVFLLPGSLALAGILVWARRRK